MTFTFVVSNNIGKVRMRIGETVEAESEISDEEITQWITDKGSDLDLAAIAILKSLAAKWARRASLTSGNEKIENGKVSENYLALAKDLEDSVSSSNTLTNRRVRRRTENPNHPYNKDLCF